jgi:chaperonin cofactor prefoldin
MNNLMVMPGDALLEKAKRLQAENAELRKELESLAPLSATLDKFEMEFNPKLRALVSHLKAFHGDMVSAKYVMVEAACLLEDIAVKFKRNFKHIHLYDKQMEMLRKERDELQARIDGGIRMHFYKKDHADYAVTSNVFPANATLIVDEGAL